MWRYELPLYVNTWRRTFYVSVQIFKFLAHSVQKFLQKNSVTNSDHISHSSNGLKS
jgi:hypothetical protein